jgi:hypothetical protein
MHSAQVFKCVCSSLSSHAHLRTGYLQLHCTMGICVYFTGFSLPLGAQLWIQHPGGQQLMAA